MISYKEFGVELLEIVKKIYEEEGWCAYLGDDEADNAFYQSFGMKKLVEGDMVSYFR